MEISDFLAAERIVLDLRARNKAAVLAEAARLLAEPSGVPAADLESALAAREALGSTGLGGGFALPHARIEAVTRYLGLFLRLARPIGFDAIDGEPVDLVFVLLTPTETAEPHVKALAAVSRKFRDAAVKARLRKAASAAEACDIVTAT